MYDNIFDANFWIAISFVIFIFLSFRAAKKTILNILDDKIANIKKNIDESKNVLSEAEDKLKAIETKINKFEEEKDLLLSQADKNTNDVVHEYENNMKNIIEHKKSDMDNSINSYMHGAMKKLQNDFVDSAIKLTASYFAKSKDNFSNSEILDEMISNDVLNKKDLNKKNIKK